MGRGRGGRSSGSRSASFNVFYEFDLFTQDDLGNSRIDIEGNSTNEIGIFPGAIEGFTLGISETLDFFLFNSSDPVNNPDNEIVIARTPLVEGEVDIENPIILNLTARFIANGQTISLPNGIEPVFPSTNPGLTIEDAINNAETRTTNNDRIEYTLTSDELSNLGIDELTLVVEDNSSQTSGEVNFENFNTIRAVNDIDYIISEGLLDNITSIRVSGSSSLASTTIISREGNTFPSDGDGDGSISTPITPEAVDDSATTEASTAVTIDILNNDNVGLIDSFDATSTQGGSIALNNNGTPDELTDDLLEYTPSVDFLGTDNFQYTINNLGLTDTATVTVEVSAPVEPVEPVEPVDPVEPVEPVDPDLGTSAVGDTVFRFFNPDVGVHFYTADQNENDFVRDNLDIYDFEGESYRTVDPLTLGAEDVYRFFNSRTGVHLYTTSEVERDSIQENLNEFSFEGTAFNAYENNVEGSIPIYRFFEPSLGVHFYTPNEVEKDFVNDNLDNYDFEGIAYYAFPLETVTI